MPHTHDASDSIDDALEASSAGIRALKISLVILLATTAAQAFVVAFSGSVALLADTVHNFSDALTAIPLWVAFVLGRRAATRRYTYGFGRAEDLAGLFIVFAVLLSAPPPPPGVHRSGSSTSPRRERRLGDRRGCHRIRRQRGAIVDPHRSTTSGVQAADGVHARTDGFTSLAVVVGGIGVLAGFPLADPIVGLIISAAIFVLLIGTIRSIGRRLMDGVEPELVDRVEHALLHVSGVDRIERVRLRWVGHRVEGDAVLVLDSVATASVSADAVRSVREHVRVDDFVVTTCGRPPATVELSEEPR